MADRVDTQLITDEEIDSLTMPMAVKMCKNHGITIKKEDAELYIMKYLIKYELLCKSRTRCKVCHFLFINVFLLSFYITLA